MVSCENAASSNTSSDTETETPQVKWDGKDNSTNSVLKNMPALDMAQYDLSVGSSAKGSSRSARAIGDVGDWSVGAGFAKALRNRAISLSRKAEYFAEMVRVLDMVFEDVELSDGTYYFSLGEMPIPFVGISVPAIMRAIVNDTNNSIAVDVAVQGEPVVQIYTDGGSDANDETQIAQVWVYLDARDTDGFWEKSWIQVDTMDPARTEIQFEQTGKSASTTTVRYNYTGSLVQDSSPDPFNLAKAAFHEKFTGGEDFEYMVQYQSKFNETHGSTVAFQKHIKPEGDDTYGPEAWSLNTNKRVDETNLELTCYFKDIEADTADTSSETLGSTGVPKVVAESAEGIFGLIDTYLLVDDPSLETYPTGISVEKNSSEEWVMELSDFSPEAGTFVNGSIALEQITENPLKLAMDGSLTATGEKQLTVVIKASATFAAGEGPPDDEPVSMSGTYDYNGTTYDLTKIVEAIDLLSKEESGGDDDGGDDDGGDGGDGGETTSPEYNPLPAETYPPGYPSSTLCFYLIATRETYSSSWEAPTEGLTQLDFTEQRDSYEMYFAGTRENEGPLNWHEPDMIKLDLYDTTDTLVYSFSVGACDSTFFYFFATLLNGEVIEPEIEYFFSTNPTFNIEDIHF